MARHADNGRNDADIVQYASRASALIAARAEQKKAPSRNAAPGGPSPRAPQPSGLAGFLRRNIVYILSAVAVIVLVAVGLVVARTLAPIEESVIAIEEEARYVSPYDWTKLDRTNGRYRYVVDGEVRSRIGVDVSENQHEIDWHAVAADGIEFAMIRLGYRGATAGDLYLDESYRQNIEGARAAGLDCGVYFFSQANSVEEAQDEADYVLENLKGVVLEYPIAFDSEKNVLDLESSRTAGLSNDEMTAICEAFCQRIEEAGYRTIVYGNSADLSRYHYENLKQDAIWWAEYGTAVPAANIDIVLWQYSNSGEVSGIPTAVDMDIDLSDALG